VTKTATILGVSKAIVPKVISAYTNHGKTSTTRNSGRKSTLTERDRRTLRRIVSKNHRSTAAQVTAKVNSHLEEPVSTKTVRRELHKSNVRSRAAITKLLITKSNAQTRKQWCHEHKTWTSDNWKRARDMFRRVVLHAVPYNRKNLRLENTKGSLQSGMPGCNSKTRGRFCNGLGSNIVVFCWPHY
jgi:anion-transporting  ArsA/GET3 family ATPase